jgi:uncharacterized oxidoreductase
MFCFSLSIPASTEGLRKEATELVSYVKATPRAPGTDAITLPGDPERNTLLIRCKNGIPLEENHWRMLASLADRLHVDLPVLTSIQA